MPSQHRQHSIVSILADKAYKTNAHLVHKIFFGDIQHLLIKICESGKKLRDAVKCKCANKHVTLRIHS